MQNTHCHGQTRLVRIVATGPGPQPHSGSSGQLNLRRSAGAAAATTCGRSSATRPSIWRPTPGITRGKGQRVFDQIDNDVFARPLANPVKFGDRLHLVQRDGGVHAAGQHQSVGINLLENLRGLRATGNV